MTKLEQIAQRVNWFTPPDEVMETNIFLNLVMARATFEDTVSVFKHYSEAQFREAYTNAPAGLYSNRSWAYWGLKLMGDPDALPHPGLGVSAKRDFNWRMKT